MNVSTSAITRGPATQGPAIRQILIVGPSWVGDMVMAQSLFMALRNQDPDVQIDVLAPGWSLPVLERMPEVRRGIDMPVGHGSLQLGVRRKIGRELSKVGYDQAIVLPNSFKSALIPWWANIPLRTGFQGEMRFGLLNDRRKLDKQLWPMTVDRFVHLAEAPAAGAVRTVPVPRFSVDYESVQSALADLKIDMPYEPVLALCPGAEYGPAKRWPEASYAGLARIALEKGWQVWLFGSGKDQPVTQKIREIAPGCIDLAGKTQLGQAIDLMSLARAVVSNDSGLMHVAAALDLPLVAIYGSSDPGFTPPLNQRHEIVRLGLECSPCFKRECPLGHLNCLNNIDVAMVNDALNRLMEKPR